MVEVIRHPDEHDWELAKLCAITTQGKRKVINPPDIEWKFGMLNARHTPIRSLHFLVRFDGIPSFVATHLARHVHATPFVQSKRDDLQDEVADRDTPLLMMMELNAEELMTIANKRLCGKAHQKTREVVRELCDSVIETNPEFEPFLVPFCKQYGCHEMMPCEEVRWAYR